MPTQHPKKSAWSKKAAVTLGILGLAAALAVGAILRLDDPLSSPVIPAEDPYTHMALVREHVRDGDMEPLNPQGNLYPPGLHAFLGAAWVYTGADLYEIVRIGPAFLGAVGVLGIGVLLWRHEGPLAAFVGAMALAVAPEAIFRTTMMSPTALDLALVPFFLYTILALLTGRLGWAAVAAPFALFLVFAHPWLLLVLCLAAAVFFLLAVLMPWSGERARPITPFGFAATAAILGGALAATGATSPGFRTTLNMPESIPFDALMLLAAGLAFLPLVLLIIWPRSLDWLFLRPRRAAMPLWARLAVVAVAGAALVLTTMPAVQQGMPEFVDLPRMFGWPILALAALAFVALPFVKGPVAHLGAGIALATYPFVIYNPLQSEFWPHRTAVFLGIGLVLLVGVAAAGIARGASALAARLARTQTNHHGLRHTMAAIVPTFLVVLLIGGGVYAATPLSYPSGWYRLYHACEMDALEEIAAQADADPNTIIITANWQPKLVLAALADDASRVWIKDTFYTDAEHREELLIHFAKDDTTVIVIVDRYIKLERSDIDTAFLQEEPFEPAGTWCANMGIEQPRISAYAVRGVEA